MWHSKAGVCFGTCCNIRCMRGVSAACLAADGFTGAPALLIEGDAEAPFWRDLGSTWEITRHYLKPYPVCRWAQPAMDAAADVIGQHRIDRNSIAGIEIRTFAAAVRLGAKAPRNTEDISRDSYPVDYVGLPLNDEGRTKALSYSESQLAMIERQCQGWPAFYFVQGPFGLKIWSETDIPGPDPAATATKLATPSELEAELAGFKPVGMP